MSLRDLLFGPPIATDEEEQERIGPASGVGVLGLDALASAAYGPEALLTVLLPLGVAGLRHLVPLTALIVTLLVIVALSYRQTIEAYPDGGGAYTVAKENLGRSASLFAGAALALDYVLNVAVAISAGVGALVSAVPRLWPHTLALCLAVLVLLTLLNLRGVRTTGLAFMLPTYLFIGMLVLVIGVGVVKTTIHGGHPVPLVAPKPAPEVLGAAPTWLLVRAFANGCTAMTGVEAVSNGTPLFRPPTAVGARRTLAAIVLSLAVLLAGITFLARSYVVTATAPGEPGYESLLSRVAAAAVGRGALYYVTIGSVVTVLAFSANTSFADFPRVCRMLAADRFLPEPFVHRGRRLTFSHGIVVLTLLSAALLVAFRGVTDRLIPLFAVGAFAAFTVSQAGMVVHWRRRTERGAGAKRVLNAVGALATGLTLIVALASKFTEGAWISAALVAGMIVLLWRVRAHYDFIARATRATGALAVGPVRQPIAVVPMRRWDSLAQKALRFAIGLSDEVIAVQVLTGDREVDDLTSRWDELVVRPSRAERRTPPELVVLRSEYRRLHGPVVDLVERLERENPGRAIAVVVPELVEPRWFYHLLHGHTAALMRALLLYRGGPQTVIVSMPWYLRDWRPERASLRPWHRAAVTWTRRGLYRAERRGG
jgi:amino acid transporter